jgi:hypothetical protein
MRADGFSKDTVRLTRATLSVMLGDAVEDHLLVMNPVMQLGRRGRRKQAGAISKAERQKKITPLSYEPLATFLQGRAEEAYPARMDGPSHAGGRWAPQARHWRSGGRISTGTPAVRRSSVPCSRVR